MPSMMTPDGRMVDVPDGMMGHFAGLSLPPEPPAPAMPPMQPGLSIPAPAIDAAPIPPPEPAPAAADVPVTSPGQVPSDGARAPRGPVTTPSEDAGQPNVPPAPKPITQGQIATMGEAGPLNAEVDALTGAKHAADRLGKAIGDQATAVGMVETAANDAADRQLAEMQRTAEANAKAVQDATDAYVQNSKRLANVRIDHGIDHPVVAAIGTALNILGTAMKKGDMSNIMKPIYDALDRKVAAQMQDIEQGKAGLGLQREAIALMRQSGSDKATLQNTLMLAGLEQAKRRIQEVKDKSTSPITRAQADQAMAEVDTRIAGAIGSAQSRYQQRQDAAAARAQAERLARAQIGVTMRGQDIQKAENDANRAERAQEHIDTIAKDLMMQGKAGAAERAKAIKDGGILDPVTHDYMMTDAGKQKMSQADAIEAQIRKDPTTVAKAYIARISDKAQADQLTEAIKDPKAAAQVAQAYADSIRSDAQINDAAVVRGSIKPDEIQKEVNKAHDVTIALDSAQRMLEKDPSSFDRKAWAALQAQLMVTNAKYVATLGERVSVKALDAFSDVMSVDPDKITSRILDTGKAIEAIKALKNAAAQAADTALGGAGIKASWKPGVETEDVTNAFAGKTAQEVAADATPGAITDALLMPKRLEYPGRPTSPFEDKLYASPQDDALTAANNRRSKSGKTSDYGLDPDVDESVRAIVKQSSTASNKAYTKIVNSLARPLVSSDRPGLDTGVAKLIRDTDPALFSDVLAKVASDAGQLRADELAKSIERPDMVKAPSGGVTPDTASDLAVKKARGKLGMPTGTYSDAPQGWDAMSKDARDKHNAFLQRNGFPPVKE